MVHVTRNLTRKSMALLTSLLLLTFWVPGLIAASPASANAGSSIPDSPWNGGDGALDTTPSITSVADSAGSFTNGADESAPCPGVTTSDQLASPKDDLSTFYFGSQDAASKVFVYLGWRRAGTSGTTTVDFELNQANGFKPNCNGVSPQRTTGDVLFTYDFQASGTNVTINFFTWDSTLNGGAGGWVSHGVITGLTEADGTTPVVEGQTNSDGSFGEMVVNLSSPKLGIFDGRTCKDFGQVWPKTRSSSQNLQNELKDFIQPSPAVISNCAPLTIYKQDAAGNALAGAHFDITPFLKGTDPDVPIAQTPCITQSDGYCYVEIPNTTPTAFAKPLLFPGNYTVTESKAPAGYLLASPSFQKVTLPQTTNSTTHAGEAVFTDPLGSLTFHKVDGDNHALGGAQFRVHPESVTGTSQDILVTDDGSGNAADGTNDDNKAAGTITVSGLKTGTYDVTEETQPTGYLKDTSTKSATIADPQLDPANDAHPEIGVADAFVDPQATTSLSIHKTYTDTATGAAVDNQGALFNLYQTDSDIAIANFDPTDTTNVTLVGSCTTNASGVCSVGDSTHIVTWHHWYYWVEESVPFPRTVPNVNVFGDGTGGIEITKDNVALAHAATQVTDPQAGITTTSPTPTVTMPFATGAGISDTATLTGINTAATGAVQFQAYGPDPSTCSSPLAFTSNFIPVHGPGNYDSNVFTPTTAGTYKWVATYYPDFVDSTHLGSNSIAGACTDTGETSVVHPAQPSMTTTTSTNPSTVDGAFHDTATLTGFAPTPTGMAPMQVTFTLYSDSTCSTLAPTGNVHGITNATNTWTVDVQSDGTATSGDYHATNSQGTYYWKAVLTGNTNNDATSANLSDDCGSLTGGNHERSSVPVLGAPHKYNSPGTNGPGLAATDDHVSIYASNNQITYTITVTNSGDADMTGVQVTDSVSSLATYNSGSIQCLADATSCVKVDNTAPALAWTFNLAAGKTATLKFSVTVNSSDLRTDVILNQAHVSNGSHALTLNGLPFGDTEITQNHLAYPNLSINKCASSPPPQSIAAGTNAACTLDPSGLVPPSSSITYDLTLTNTGNADATGVTVTDAVPTHTSFAVASCDSPCTASQAGGTVTWSNVTVPKNGGTTVVHFTVNVDSNVANGDHIDNVGSFTWSNSGSTTTHDQSGTSATVRHVVGFPVITGGKTANPLPIGDPIPGSASTADGIVHLGDAITYTVSAANAGLAPSAVTITDAIPTGTTYQGGAQCDTGAPADCVFVGNTGGVLEWTMTLPGNSTATVSFPVTVSAADTNGQILSNFADVNNVTTRTVTHKVTFPIVTAVKSSIPASGTAGSPTLVGPNTKIAYTVSVNNAGLQDATGVTVSDAVPSGTTYDANASCGTAPSCTVSTTTNASGDTTITWHLDVPATSTELLTFSLTTPAVQSKVIDNTATFTNTNTPGCTTPTCDTNTTHHQVVFPVITAHKTSDPASGTVANPATVSPGQTITYTIAVGNSGQQDASGVTVTDVVPAGTTYVAGSADNGGTYDAATNTVSWTVAVGIGVTKPLSFQAKVPAAAANGTLIDNTASFANVHTPGCAGATCTTETTHHEVRFAVLTLAKSSNPVSGSIVQRGDRIDYTVTLVNSGLAASPVTTVTDTLPDHVTVVNGSPAPAFTTVNGNVVTWAVSVPAGQTSTLTYAVTVDKDAPEGATLTNVALVDGQCVGNADPSACTTDHHVPTGALTLVKHVDKTVASYGDTLTYTFDASTTGALDQTGVVVTDVLPKGTAYVNNSAACSDAGTCTTSFNGTSKTVTWGLGDMAAGSTRHLVFKVTIVKPAFNSATGLPAATIVNSGAVQSTETPRTPSNQVVTKVVAVLAVKVVRAPKLAFTGLPAQAMAMLGILMLGAGIVLTSVRRKEQ